MTSTLAPGSALALAPGYQLTITSLVPGTGANTAPLPNLIPADGAYERGASGDYFGWLNHVQAASACVRPVRLAGQLLTVDTRTGEILTHTPTSHLPDGVIYKACGNRRATVCPCCAETYRRDAFQLVRAGLVGGKTVPESVAQHPAVFATFTAPSFGTVHTRTVRNCLCRGTCTCTPLPCHARRDAPTCPHGTTLTCWQRHDNGDQALGQPLCPDCYDHDHHVVWNGSTGELWRRTKQDIERHLNRLARSRGLARIRVSHGKAAEYQIRGAVHFHVLLRLDGRDPDDPSAVIPPPDGLGMVDLEEAIRHAGNTGYTTAAHPERPAGWAINWGTQLDIRPISLSADNPLDDLAVAAYLAKYATKGTEITGHNSRKLTSETLGIYANPTGTHTERLIHTAWTLGEHEDFANLRRWAHMLGFGGHFLTKARHYSVTFTELREARTLHQRAQASEHQNQDEHRQDDLDEETEQTTLVIGQLQYAGSGWHSPGDQLLANTAAADQRRSRQAGREELAHELHVPNLVQQAA